VTKETTILTIFEMAALRDIANWRGRGPYWWKQASMRKLERRKFVERFPGKGSELNPGWRITDAGAQVLGQPHRTDIERLKAEGRLKPFPEELKAKHEARMETTPKHECPGEEVGAAMHDYIVATYGRKPTVDEFNQIYWHWEEEVERVFG